MRENLMNFGDARQIELVKQIQDSKNFNPENADFFMHVYAAAYVGRKMIIEELFEDVIIDGRPMFENFSEEDQQEYNRKKSSLKKKY